MTTVRETKRADELKPGDWLAEDENGVWNPNEVMAVFEYPTALGPRVHLTTQVPGRSPCSCGDLSLDQRFELVTEAELAALREQADRAQKIADIRALADFLDAHPDVPAPDSVHAQASPGRYGDVWNSGLAGIAEVRRVAEIFGEKVRQDDERTEVVKLFGGFPYTYIAWHKDGRPAEPELEPADDPTGLAYTRADDEPDDPTPVSPARVPMHTGAMTDGGLVDETPAEPGAAIAADASITGAAVTDSCVFVGDKGGFCTTHDAVHIASGVGECGCPVYPFAGRGDAADMIIDHRRACPDHPSES